MRFAHFDFDPETDRLGEGPLSEVYRAVDTKLGRTVALKILRAHAEIAPQADRRFHREAKHTSRLDHPHIASLVQTDNLAAAKIAGDYIVEQLGGDGSVLILGGSAGHQTGNARRDGVKGSAEAAGHDVIFQICDWQDACAFETSTNFLQSNPNIKSIFSAWDPGALAAVSASKAHGKLDNQVIVGFDGHPANLVANEANARVMDLLTFGVPFDKDLEDKLVAIEEGEQTATIKQDNTRMGIESVQNLVNVIKGDGAPDVVPIDGILITADNVAEFK